MRLRDEDLFTYSFEELMNLFSIKAESGWMVGEMLEASEHLKMRDDLTPLQKDALYSYYPYVIDDIYFYLRDNKNKGFEFEFTNLILELRYNVNESIQDILSKYNEGLDLSDNDIEVFKEVFGNRIVDQVFDRLNFILSSNTRKKVIERTDKMNDIEWDARKPLYQFFCLYRRRQFLVPKLDIAKFDVDAIEDFLRTNSLNSRTKSYIEGIRMSASDAQGVNESVSLGKVNNAYEKYGYANLVKYFALQKFQVLLKSGLQDNPIIDIHSIRGLEITEHDHLFEKNKNYPIGNGYLDVNEDDVQISFEKIFKASFHKKDWGGEENDLYLNYVSVKGIQNKLSAAFLLKGNGLRKNVMQIRDLGKNGDQLVRLFQSPAELFVLQFVGNLSENLIKDFTSKCRSRRLQGIPTWGCIINGTETSKIMKVSDICD